MQKIRTLGQVFTPPSQGRDNDWVLLLDDAARNYPLPKRWTKG